MLEFYPMPTNLNNGGALYSHHHHHHHATNHIHQNHGTAARFLDNTNPNTINNNSNNCTSSTIPLSMPVGNSQGLTNNNNNNICGPQHQQQHQQQLLHMTSSSPAYASCPPLTTNNQPVNTSHNNNNNNHTTNSPISLCTTAASSLTAQTLPSAPLPPTTTPTSQTNTATAAAAAAAAAVVAAVSAAANASVNHNIVNSITSTASSAVCSSTISSPSTTSLSLSSSTSASASTPIPTTLSSTLKPTSLSASPPTSAINSCTNNTNLPVSVMLSTTLSSSGSVQCSTTSTPIASVLSSSSSTSLSMSLSSSSSLLGKPSADCNGRTEVGHIKCEKIFEICEGCGQKIHDRFLMNVGDTNWHEQCLACCYCGTQLHHTCYVRNTKLYCKLDYDRLFGIKCAACCHPVQPQEMVMRPIPNFIFHLTCFVCYACRLPLQKGEQFMVRDGQLLCFRHDLEKEMYLAAAQHCGFVGLDEDELMRPRDGRRGPKRPRTILTSQQRKQFKASFDQSPKPCRKVREALAKDTGLSVRVVQVWFQNQRAKMKKIQRKAKNGGSTAANGGNNSRTGGGDDKDKDKDEKSVKQESASGSESGYLGGLDSAFASQPLNPNLPFSPEDYPAHSNDSFCSSDLSLDGSNFDQLDDDADSLSLNNLELQSTSSSGHHHHHHHHHHHSNPHDMIASLNTSLINPIDKLYLMQNSYFSSEQ